MEKNSALNLQYGPKTRLIRGMYLTEGFLNTYPVNVEGYCGVLCLRLLLQAPIIPTLAKLGLMLIEEVGIKKTTFMAKSWPWPFIC